MRVVVTGGAGYIGSHAVQLLLEGGHSVAVIDNLYRGHAAALDRLRGSMKPGERLSLHEADCTDYDAVLPVLAGADAVMHFAALTYVGESVEHPLEYHRVNTGGMVTLLRACAEHGVGRFIFSSTAATYGEPEEQPIRETTAQAPINPYGASKLAAERVLLDHGEACRRAGVPFASAALRYFNVAGADPTGVLGEWHKPETHLVPLVIDAARGVRESITVFGRDYPTPDGTCIRDYVHVRDLVEAHAEVLGALRPGDACRFNIGTGRGLSVDEIVGAVRRVTGREFAVRDGERRAGDPPELVADPSRIAEEIGWRARFTDIDETVRTAWAWFESNPRGYDAG
jgi:UDP-glucose 4-epimerase